MLLQRSSQIDLIYGSSSEVLKFMKEGSLPNFSVFQQPDIWQLFQRQSYQPKVDHHWVRALQPHGYCCVICLENELSHKAELDGVAIAL